MASRLTLVVYETGEFPWQFRLSGLGPEEQRNPIRLAEIRGTTPAP